jgi:hypothetical protein
MSKLWELSGSDFFNGLIMAVIMPVVLYLSAVFSELARLALNGDPFQITIEWKVVLVLAITGFLGYLVKRLTSGPTGTVLSNK